MNVKFTKVVNNFVAILAAKLEERIFRGFEENIGENVVLRGNEYWFAL